MKLSKLRAKSIDTFNRTKLELKLIMEEDYFEMPTPFNRTKLELK